MSEKKGFLGGLFGGKKSDCCNIQIVADGDGGACTCGTGGACGAEEAVTFIEGAISIKVLGPGCKNCVTLEHNTRLALAQLGIQANLEKVSDMSAIAGYGIMSTPALLINEKLVSFGKVLKPKDIVKLIEQENI